MPKAPPTSTSNAIASSSKLTPKTYRALKTEQGVFTTPPYSGELKGLWKFKDEGTARQSAESLWERFEVYRRRFRRVGEPANVADGSMDITRKFIQMGRTRSLRYALRKGGRKYEPLESDPKDKIKGRRKTKEEEDEERKLKTEIPRTGEVYDQEKLNGANVFEEYLAKCWESEEYSKAWEEWREAGKSKGKGSSITNH